jgi:hypothetical protein
MAIVDQWEVGGKEVWNKNGSGGAGNRRAPKSGKTKK